LVEELRKRPIISRIRERIRAIRERIRGGGKGGGEETPSSGGGAPSEGKHY
jgi:hypothetical protein